MRQKLEGLSAEMHRKQLKEVRQKHREEKFALKEEFEEQLEEMKNFWKQKYEDYDAQSNRILEELNQRQLEERQEYEKNIRANLFVHPRMTPEMLNTEYQIQTLVKTQRYNEADRLQKKSLKLKDEILSKVGSLAQFKINNLLGRLDKKQKVEKDAVLKKIKSGKLDIEKKRDKDILIHVNKFKALMENQEEIQKAEIMELEKNFQNFKPSTNLLGKVLKTQQLKSFEPDSRHSEETNTLPKEPTIDKTDGREEAGEPEHGDAEVEEHEASPLI